MVITGASRSVAVKLFYDLGFRNPLFVTLLYLTGQGLSLVVYFISRRSSPSPARRRPRYKKVSIELPTRHVVPNPMHSTDDDECPGDMEDEAKAPVVEAKDEEKTPERRRSGSPTGLTTESHNAATCVEIKFYGASSTPSMRRLLDGVAVPVPYHSTEPARLRHRREMT